jgi:hypothetical protein
MKDVLEYTNYRSTLRTITPRKRPSPHSPGKSSREPQASLRQFTLNTRAKAGST